MQVILHNTFPLRNYKEDILEVTMLLSIVLTITILFALPQHAGYTRNPQQKPNSQSSILEVNSETVRVKLLDAFSGKTISNSDVDVSSESTIRCFRAPCWSNAKQWRGRSDANGYVVIPTNILNNSTLISTPAHWVGKNLISDSKKVINGAWVVKLIPNHTRGSWPNSHRLMLIDAESNRPLINTQVRVSFDENESFEIKTNSLGYIYFPIEKTGMSGWVIVTGYRRTKITWGWVKMRLEKQ